MPGTADLNAQVVEVHNSDSVTAPSHLTVVGGAMLLPEHDGSFEIHLGSQNPGQKLWVYYITQVDGQYVFSDGVEITIPNN